jgi:phosphatidylserine/phosphatidylglycerophosphate/cardiolipin synthase-like enzyme
MFLFFHDPIGLEIADALIECVRAGVVVRVLINVAKTKMGDPFSTGEKRMMRQDPGFHGDPVDIEKLRAKLEAGGVQVRDTNIDYDLVVDTPDPHLRAAAEKIRATIDLDAVHVDHRKLIIIDGRVAYCGGANVGAQYLYHDAFDPAVDARVEADQRKAAQQREPWWKWHDSLTRFEGPVATKLEAFFRERWILDGGDGYESLGLRAADPGAPTLGQVVHEACLFGNAPNDEPNEVCQLYLRLIREAKRSIFLENPYLYNDGIIDALCAAKNARPTLSVVLVVPCGEHNDNKFGQDAQEHAYVRYLACGIEVYEYQHHFTHLKVAVFDDRWSIHGSTNLNFRSLDDDNDFELVVLVDDEPFAKRVLEQTRDVDLAVARRIEPDDVHGAGWKAIRRRVRNPWTILLGRRRLF